MSNTLNNNHCGNELDKSNDYAVIDCKLCKFKHLSPIPTDENINKFYQNQYYQTHKNQYIKVDHQELSYGKIFFDERLDFFEKNTKGNRLLDVGCGAGFFLDQARKRGWNVFGVEPSKIAANFAIENFKIKVFNQTFDLFYKTNYQKFDVIHLKNVLEHVPDPEKVLSLCYELLQSNGLLYVEVPNDYNIIQKIGVLIAREKNHWVCIPDHINYFNFVSIKRLLKKNGFKILQQSTTFPMYISLCIGQNFVKNKLAGKKMHQFRKKFELFFENHKLGFARQFIYRFLSKLYIGRTAIIYCKKAENHSIEVL